MILIRCYYLVHCFTRSLFSCMFSRMFSVYLFPRFFFVHGEFDEWRQMYQLLPTRQPDKHAHDVSEERAVGVAPVLEVHNYQQLREQNYVNKVGTHGPEKQKKQNMTVIFRGN